MSHPSTHKLRSGAAVSDPQEFAQVLRWLQQNEKKLTKAPPAPLPHPTNTQPSCIVEKYALHRPSSTGRLPVVRPKASRVPWTSFYVFWFALWTVATVSPSNWSEKASAEETSEAALLSTDSTPDDEMQQARSVAKRVPGVTARPRPSTAKQVARHFNHHTKHARRYAHVAPLGGTPLGSTPLSSTLSASAQLRPFDRPIVAAANYQ